jgi:hypothetical protein
MVTAVIRSGISRVKSTRGLSGGKFSRMGRNFEIAALLMAAALLTAAALWGCSGSASAHPAEAQDELALDTEVVFAGDELEVHGDLRDLKAENSFTPTEQEELTIKDLQTSGDYDVVIYEGPGDFETLKIFKGDQVAYVYGGYRLYVGSFADIGCADTQTAMGMDITGDGIANAVISEWTGGRDGCYLSHVFELGHCLRKIAVIDGVRECPRFVNLDVDSSLEVVVRDWAFLGSPLLGADEYAPEVVLKYRDGAYWVADNLMVRRVADEDELIVSAANIRADLGWLFGEAPTRALCRHMLDLIYSGNAGLAWDYCKAAWHPGAPGREDFLAQFRMQLAESLYLEDIDLLNNGRALCPEADDR